MGGRFLSWRQSPSGFPLEVLGGVPPGQQLHRPGRIKGPNSRVRWEPVEVVAVAAQAVEPGRSFDASYEDRVIDGGADHDRPRVTSRLGIVWSLLVFTAITFAAL
jgi:hypothetical protein